jgi:hypothetical protein
MSIIRRVAAFLGLVLPLASCSTYHARTAEDYCAQLTGVNLSEAHAPSWAVFPGVQFHGDAIRDSYVRLLDSLSLEKVGHRADRMVWREGLDLHIESLATLMQVDADSVTNAWHAGLQRGKTGRHEEGDACLFGAISGLFDRVHVHTGIWDQFGYRIVKDSVVSFDMERAAKPGSPL